jgi:hypothetical protein
MRAQVASYRGELSPTKNKFNTVVRARPHISDIKLIRTDTTLDLSQKAEKGMSCLDTSPVLLYPPRPASTTSWGDVVLIITITTGSGANDMGLLSKTGARCPAGLRALDPNFGL